MQHCFAILMVIEINFNLCFVLNVIVKPKIMQKKKKYNAVSVI